MFLPSMWKLAKPARLAAACTDFGSMRLGRNHTPPRASSSSVSSASTAIPLPSLPDALEMVVVIVGVVELAAGTPDDAPCPARAHAGSLHRVLAIIAAALFRQRAFAVAEDRAVLRVRKRPALANQRDRLPRLGRKLGDASLGDGHGGALRERGLA